MENNGGPLTTLPVDRLKGVVCNADARAKSDSEGVNLGVIIVSLKRTSKEYKKVPWVTKANQTGVGMNCLHELEVFKMQQYEVWSEGEKY